MSAMPTSILAHSLSNGGGLFALGLMAKPMLVTLPFVLLLLDYWPLGRMGMPVAAVLSRFPGV